MGSSVLLTFSPLRETREDSSPAKCATPCARVPGNGEAISAMLIGVSVAISCHQLTSEAQHCNKMILRPMVSLFHGVRHGI